MTAKYANHALVYRNATGEKVRRKAGAIFDDATETDLLLWEKTGAVRNASVGEIAEAVAAGLYDPGALPTADEEGEQDEKKSRGRKRDALA